MTFIVSKHYTDRQLEILETIRKGNPDGSFIDMDQLKEHAAELVNAVYFSAMLRSEKSLNEPAPGWKPSARSLGATSHSTCQTPKIPRVRSGRRTTNRNLLRLGLLRSPGHAQPVPGIVHAAKVSR
jgi:hypothetical protein